MAALENEFVQQFHEMKEKIKNNKPSKHDRIPTGIMNRNIVVMKHQLFLSQSLAMEDAPLQSLQTNSDPISCQHL